MVYIRNKITKKWRDFSNGDDVHDIEYTKELLSKLSNKDIYEIVRGEPSVDSKIEKILSGTVLYQALLSLVSSDNKLISEYKQLEIIRILSGLEIFLKSKNEISQSIIDLVDKDISEKILGIIGQVLLQKLRGKIKQFLKDYDLELKL